ncbi:hypothetical protein L486_06857 [Kwoniella mangroviensis CBS 10435]|uniref:Ketoreductase domain-containing protein n=1 Tax=Kwoniella mangroviensis CBS 10435 TaxID=1331196 RepID=A0A1B9IJ13_9TREE|nr:uncharacterized protein I203_06876 [Kwoniella mangroviensis CBS 8507]OCF55374.1 hypothetical protein L486_06857 [Kwoniella mangroviensis CBS 10435]OCF63920.1 hypothetical protein I203_06876 [Kwoniella mangroviensis CBS 8507]OCF73898.1 hypothetical protein I204_05743 [Kwoniella mangroviensis CBS 8886]
MSTVLITGTNRGIGLGLAKAYAQQSNNTVILGLRNVDSMPEIDVRQGVKLVKVKIDSGDIESAKKAMEELKSQGINKIDLVIANAAIGDCFGALKEVDLGSFEEHWRINVLAPLALFQACVPLMPEGSKFVWMSSGASIIDRVPDKLDAGYGITKSSMNYLARYAHFEEPSIISFSLSPGWVQTDMGDRGARWSGMEKAPITVDESVAGIVKVIGEATKDNYSGLHMRYNGTQSKW